MKNKDLLVLETNDYKVELKITGLNKDGYPLKNQKQFNDYTWEEIQEMVKSGNHTFKVGDIKTINLRDKIHEIVIIGVNRDGDNTITCQFRDVVFDSYMNEEATNKGGFAKSDLFRYLKSDFKSELFRTLKININNYDVFLPSEFEVFGENKYSEKEIADKQYEYFKDKRNRLKFDYDEEYMGWWWLRSARDSTATRFVSVSNYGSVGTNGATGSVGVAPCFII